MHESKWKLVLSQHSSSLSTGQPCNQKATYRSALDKTLYNTTELRETDLPQQKQSLMYLEVFTTYHV